MKLDECKDLKIGDCIKVKGLCDYLYEATIVAFEYKAVKYKYLDSPDMEPKKAMYYDIIGKINEDELQAFKKEQERVKKIKPMKCPDCRKPIEKCKCTE